MAIAVHECKARGARGVRRHCCPCCTRWCPQACQLRLCQAFANIYKASNNESDPWDNEEGWELTATAPCSRLVGAGAPGSRGAAYCSWFGISCCTPQALAARGCAALNTVTALELPINNLNVSLAHPLLLPSLRALHGCGLRVLNLEANNIVGSFSDDWAALDKLTVFNFGAHAACLGRLSVLCGMRLGGVLGSGAECRAHAQACPCA